MRPPPIRADPQRRQSFDAAANRVPMSAPLSALPLLSHLGRLSTQRRLGLPFGLSLPAGLANISSFHIPAGGPPRGGPAPLQASFWLCAPRTGSSMKGPRRTSARRRAEADAEQAYRVAQSFQLGDGLRHRAAGTRGRPKRCVQARYDKNVERAPSLLPSNVRRVFRRLPWRVPPKRCCRQMFNAWSEPMPWMIEKSLNCSV
jgi:hypothetical protein